MLKTALVLMRQISTRAPTGGATNRNTSTRRSLQISTRAPTGGATSVISLPPRAYTYFYSRPHGRGDGGAVVYLLPATYFYSRPHGRGDLRALKLGISLRISTRAPTGGATFCRYFNDAASLFEISTRAPTGGATFRAPLGRFIFCISTRAPTGGATFAFFIAEGATKFLLAPPREGRRVPPGRCGRESVYFYSRPHGRGDISSR